MDKKAQEEMVGFVLIMLVVAVIFLVFLGIFLRGGGSKDETGSIEIDQFLGSALQYTTECGDYSPDTVKELVRECSKNGGSSCNSASSHTVCESLKLTLQELIESSWNFGMDSPDKGYLVQVIRETSTGKEIVGNISLSRYSSTSTVRSAEKPLSDGLILYMEIYS